MSASLHQKYRLKFFVRNEIQYLTSIQIALFNESQSGKVSVAEPITFRELENNELSYSQKPLINLSEADAQQLMDGLYDAGIRPTAGAGSIGQLSAVQYHLQDMRSLVFKNKGATK
jgi:hypothetical protein